jgi:predicted permease
VNTLKQDLRYAVRMLTRTPGFTLVAVLTLALGIGANTAIFTIVNALLLRPLPYAAPERLVMVWQDMRARGGPADEWASPGNYVDWSRDTTVFAGVAAIGGWRPTLTGGAEPEPIPGEQVTYEYFSVLGVSPAIGRAFRIEDDVPNAARVAIIGDGLWKRRFGGDPSIVGRTVSLSGDPHEIIGVLPPGFRPIVASQSGEIWRPLRINRANPARGAIIYRAIGRLKNGMSLDRAQAAATALARQLEAAHPEANERVGFNLQPLHDRVVGDIRPGLLALLGAVAFVLLIACANIANLLLARAAKRTSEMAVRLSIGANRAQLIRQLLSESLILAALGGLVGLLVAKWTLYLIAALLPEEASQTFRLELDPTVLLFAAALTIGTGLLFGLFPALHSTRPDLLTTLKGQAGQPSGAKGAARFRTSLAVFQIAISMALLIAAGLFVKSLANVSRVDLGLKTENVVTFGISPELNAYTQERSQALFTRMEETFSGLPGVTGVTAAVVPVLSGSNWGTDVNVEGFKRGPDIDSNTRFNMVGANYFKTLGIPLLAGREFTDRDAAKAPKIAIINQAFAKKFNLGDNPVGKRMSDDDDKLDTEIVGIARDSKYSEVKDAVPALFFVPYKQTERIRNITFYVKTAGDPSELIAQVPRVMQQLDPNLPVEELRTLEQQAQQNVFLDRFISIMSTSFAVLATLLAAVGLYGVLAYTVSQRTREIGLRMALGAAPARVRLMILRQVGLMTVSGAFIGLLVAIWIARTAEEMLFEMKGRDPVVFAAAALTLAFVALAAGLIPAHRASKVDPMTALRYE